MVQEIVAREELSENHPGRAAAVGDHAKREAGFAQRRHCLKDPRRWFGRKEERRGDVRLLDLAEGLTVQLSRQVRGERAEKHAHLFTDGPVSILPPTAGPGFGWGRGGGA